MLLKNGSGPIVIIYFSMGSWNYSYSAVFLVFSFYSCLYTDVKDILKTLMIIIIFLQKLWQFDQSHFSTTCAVDSTYYHTRYQPETPILALRPSAPWLIWGVIWKLTYNKIKLQFILKQIQIMKKSVSFEEII
jgi:hypothetical protein